MDEKVRRITNWLKGRKDNPFKLDIFLTHKCNLNCVFCNYPRKKHVKELDKKTIMRIAQEAGELGVKIIGILGGEPFVRKNVLLDFMKEIKKRGIAGSIVTNGVLIGEKEIKKIIKIRWDLIRFSLDGSNAAIHDALRGCKGSFNKLISTIHLFQRLKKEYGSLSPTIEINTVLCKNNLTDICNIIKLCHSLEIKRVYFLPMIEFVKSIESLKLKKEDSEVVSEEIVKAEKISNKLRIITNLSEIKKDSLFVKTNEVSKILLSEDKIKERNYIPCFMPWYAITIDAEGYATPCGQIDNTQGVSIRKASLRNVWLSNYFNQLRNDMLKKKLSPGCSRCCMPILDENKDIRWKLSK